MNEILFTYFTTDNKSGKKCNEKWLKTHNYDLYFEIFNWCEKIIDINDLTFKQKVYHYISKVENVPKCLECQKTTKYRDIHTGYSKFCSAKCSYNSNHTYENWVKSYKENNPTSENILKKRKETILKNYDSYEEYLKIKTELHKNNFLKKHGVAFIFLLEDFKIKRKSILKEKYGDENWNNKEKTKNTRISNGNQIDDFNVLNFKDYKKVSTNRTTLIFRHNEHLINPENLLRGLKSYHIDHRFSIKQGFLNNIPLEIITHPFNLKMIWYKDNLTKQDKCEITLEELLFNIINYENDVIIEKSTLSNTYSKNNLIPICKNILNNLNNNFNND